jgi:hypothetical protein
MQKRPLARDVEVSALGMVSSYRARDTKLNRDVAIKVLAVHR